MTKADPHIIDSPLSQTVTHDGITVQVAIFRLETDHEWSLEVVNDASTSTVWEDTFATDADALAAFLHAVASEGMSSFLDENPSASSTIH